MSEAARAGSELEGIGEEIAEARALLAEAGRELDGQRHAYDSLRSFVERALAAVPCPVVAVDGGLRVRVWNHAAEAVWDIPAARSLGKRLTDVVGSFETDVLAHAAAQDPHADRSEPASIELRAPTGHVTVEVLPVILPADGTTGVLLVVRPAAGWTPGDGQPAG